MAFLRRQNATWRSIGDLESSVYLYSKYKSILIKWVSEYFGKFSKSYSKNKPCTIKVQSAKYGIENCNLSRHLFCNKIMTCRTKNINRLFGASHLQSFTCYCFTFCWFNDAVYDFGNFALTHSLNSFKSIFNLAAFETKSAVWFRKIALFPKF